MVNFSMLGLRECDRLEGPSNFTPWKCKLQILMEEFDLWSIFYFWYILMMDHLDLWNASLVGILAHLFMI